MKSINQHEILAKLESISKDYPKKILRINGFLDEESFELLVYKGISSCTTHPTEIDINSSPLPNNAVLDSAELIDVPIDPSNNLIVKEGLQLDYFLNSNNWED